jgi:hypothetical protein
LLDKIKIISSFNPYSNKTETKVLPVSAIDYSNE